MNRLKTLTIGILFLALSPGCTTTHYLFQASSGQLALFNKARPIEVVLKNRRIHPRVKEMLSEIAPVKAWGEKNGLKSTSNYQEFVQLDRDAAVYVVSACDPLQFDSKVWSFPLAGSFTYLGWFSKESALAHAHQLKAEGLDVAVRGASAYSTLGWFRDPVLSSMLPQSKKRKDAMGDLINVILHESVHATFYLNGQSVFNESVASFVADQMTLDYMKEKRPSAELQAYLKAEEKGEQRKKRLVETYQKLAELYRSSLPKEKKLAQKKKILQSVQKELGFQRELNNATLVGYQTYQSALPEFNEVFQSCGRDWKKFWGAIQKLDAQSFRQEQQEDIGSVVLQAKPFCSSS